MRVEDLITIVFVAGQPTRVDQDGLLHANVSVSVLDSCVLPAGLAASLLECLSIRKLKRFAALVGVCVLAHGIGRLFFA